MSALKMWGFPQSKTHVIAGKVTNVLAVTSHRHALTTSHRAINRLLLQRTARRCEKCLMT